jgi:large subunit ribosomal protein L17
MRHLNSGRKLNRSAAHRKAKELRRFADRLVSLGKQATLAARRRAFDRVRDREAVTKLFEVLAPRFGNRPGGYTRIVKLGLRAGDAAPISLIEWTGRGEEGKKKGKGKAKKAAKAPAKQEAAPRRRAAAG